MKEQLRRVLGLGASAIILGYAVIAQSGGAYEIKQSVIAGGGGASSGGTYSLSGTAGQPAASNSGGSPYVVRGGFWQAELAPTAALVSVRGRVLDSAGNGLAGVVLTLADSGGAIRRTLANPLGYFAFEDVEAGESYLVSPSHRTFSFAPRIITVSDEISDLTIVAMDQ